MKFRIGKISPKVLLWMFVVIIGGLSVWQAQAQVRWPRLMNAWRDPVNWVSYGHDFTNQRYGLLDQINTGNIKRLVLNWSLQFGARDAAAQVFCSPLVYNGVMYATGTDNRVFAVNTRTGRRLWNKQVPIAQGLREEVGLTNYGVALHNSRLYWLTSDAQLFALRASTGSTVWSVRLADYTAGYRGIGAPLALKDRIIVGVATGNAGVRGFIDAYDADQGKRLWRFSTVPVPGEPGADSWEGDTWMNGGGETWMTGAYDPDLDLLYWGIGSPVPHHVGDERKGDNLYTNCIVALNPETGRLVWQYQVVPHDLWNYSAARDLVLVDMEWEGATRKVLVMATAGGYFLALDRTTGEKLYVKPYARNITWASGMNADGRPIVRESAIPQPGSDPVQVSPPAGGARNPSPMAFSRRTGYAYFFSREGTSQITPDRVAYRQGRAYRVAEESVSAVETSEISAFIAVDVQTGEIAWRQPMSIPMQSGVLATAGGLVFVGDQDGYAYAFHEKTGEQLWKFQLGAGVAGSPITYRVEGKQQIAFLAGNGGLYAFQLFEPMTPERVHIGMH